MQVSLFLLQSINPTHSSNKYGSDSGLQPSTVYGVYIYT